MQFRCYSESFRAAYSRSIVCWLIACSCLFTWTVQAATLSSTVNRNELAINQTLVLTIVYDAQVDSSAIDVSPLQNNFEVLAVSPQTSTSMTIVNGVTENASTTRWTVTLAAKRTGELQIPSFTIGAAKSQPISISVSNPSVTSNPMAATEPLSVAVSVEPVAVYAEQQFILKVQLVLTKNLSDLGGSQLTIDGADIRPLGQQTYQQVDNGIATQVVELRYAIFPQKVGSLTIPALRYTGVLGGRRSLFDSFGMRGEQVIARSQPVTIDVKPKVERADAEWFPASNVAVQSSWSSDIKTLTVGQPVTRTITITAQDQRAALIPPLPETLDTSAYKAYQDQPQLSDVETERGLVGTRIESLAVVVSQPGELRLPEVRIPWWNTETAEWQEAVVAEQVLFVVADQPAESAGRVDMPSKNEIQPSQDGVQSHIISGVESIVWIAVVSLLALIIALQFFVITRFKRQLKGIREDPMRAFDEQQLSSEEAWSALLDQLKKQDLSGTRIALTQWLRVVLKTESDTPLRSLLMTLDDANLSAQVARLDRRLYLPTGHNEQDDDYNFQALAQAALDVRATLQTQKAEKIESSLPPLYPNQ